MLICVFKENDLTSEALANILNEPFIRFLAAEIQSASAGREISSAFCPARAMSNRNFHRLPTC
jgi:hypothetical protein